MTRVVISRSAEKDLKKVPSYIYQKYLYWVDLITDIGLQEARKFKGFHDEPLFGMRKGQRSVRLSKSYRAIYIENDDLMFIYVIEVNKHDY